MFDRIKELRAKRKERRNKPWSRNQKIVFIITFFLLTVFCVVTMIINSQKRQQSNIDNNAEPSAAIISNEIELAEENPAETTLTNNSTPINAPQFRIGTIDIILIVGISGVLVVRRIMKKKKEK